MHPTTGAIILGAAVGITCYIIGFWTAIQVNKAECFEAVVGVKAHIENGFPGPFDQTIIGDAVFCGELSNIKGPSELYHEPHTVAPGRPGDWR